MKRIPPRMREVMEEAAMRDGVLRGKPRTHAGLNRRGYLDRNIKTGVPYLSVEGYRAIGRKHPYEWAIGESSPPAHPGNSNG